MSVVLTGFMGSGKSSVGRQLSRRLKRPLIDLDACVVQAAGCSIAELWARDGEAGFRRRETQALHQALEENVVISTGGGIVTQAENRALLHEAASRGATIVYLRAESGTLAARIRRQPGTRPLIDGDGQLDMQQTQARIEELLQERAAWYQEVATLEVRTDGRHISQIVDEIAAHISTQED